MAPPFQRSARRSGRSRATSSIIRAKLAEVVLDAQPLPDVGRYAVARRVGGQRGLGGGVHAPLGGVAVLARGGIEVGAARVGDDRDVAVGLAARGQRPVDLAVVEDVDVVV